MQFCMHVLLAWGGFLECVAFYTVASVVFGLPGTSLFSVHRSKMTTEKRQQHFDLSLTIGSLRPFDRSVLLFINTRDQGTSK